MSRTLTYKEFYKKYFGKNTAAEILFGWFDYCRRNNIDVYADKIDAYADKDLHK